MIIHFTLYLLVPILSIFVVFFLYATRNFNYFKKRNIPYLHPVPIFGNASKLLTFRENFGEFVRHLYNDSKEPFFGFFIGDDPYLLVRDPELIKSILVTDFGTFSNRSITNNMKDDPMGSSMMFLSKTPDWTSIRRKTSPVFSSGKLKFRHQLMIDSAREMIDFIKKELRNSSTINVRDISGRFTTDVTSSTTLGIVVGSFKNESSMFRHAANVAFNWSIWERAIAMSYYYIAPKLVKLFKMKFVPKEAAEFLRSAFWEVMEEREKTRDTKNDLIDIMIRLKNEETFREQLNLDGDSLVAQATQFFIAGHETTSTTISLTLYELAVNKECQDLLRQEINETIKLNGSITYEGLNGMKYLDICMKEALRKYPSLPFLDRRCKTNYTLPGTNVVLEKGLPIYIPMWGLHYDPQYYPNPETFDPLRFTPENIETRPPYTYLPFGEGPRKCIGARFGMLSSKCGVAHLISKFEIDICKETGHPISLDNKGILLAPIGGLYLRFKEL